MIKAKIYKLDGQPNINGIVYPKEELENAVKKFNDSDMTYATMGVYPPKNFRELDMSTVAAKTTLAVDGEYVVANINFLKTPDGARAADVFDDIGLTLMPASIGNLNKEEKTVTELQISTLTFVPLGSVEIGDNADGLFVMSDDK